MVLIGVSIAALSRFLAGVWDGGRFTCSALVGLPSFKFSEMWYVSFMTYHCGVCASTLTRQLGSTLFWVVPLAFVPGLCVPPFNLLRLPLARSGVAPTSEGCLLEGVKRLEISLSPLFCCDY